MKAENILEAVHCMIGDFKAIGETNHDNEAYENLERLGLIAVDLVHSVAEESLKSNSYEYSVKQNGELATKILRSIKEDIDDYFLDLGEEDDR